MKTFYEETFYDYPNKFYYSNDYTCRQLCDICNVNMSCYWILFNRKNKLCDKYLDKYLCAGKELKKLNSMLYNTGADRIFFCKPHFYDFLSRLVGKLTIYHLRDKFGRDVATKILRDIIQLQN